MKVSNIRGRTAGLYSLLTIGGLVIGSLVFQWLNQGPDQPQLRFDHVSFDAGTVENPNNHTVTHVYSFRNQGRQPLEIIDIQTSCGCTIAESGKRVYEPGEEGVVEAKLTLPSIGEKGSTIVIKSNDPSSPHRLMIKGSFYPQATLSIIPKQVKLGPVFADAATKRQISVQLLSKNKIDAKLKVKTSSPALKAEVVNTVSPPYRTHLGYWRTRYDLELTVTPGAEDKVAETLTVTLESDLVLPIETRVEGDVVDPWISRPQRVLWVTSQSAPIGADRKISLRNGLGQPFTCRVVDSSVPDWLEVKIGSDAAAASNDIEFHMLQEPQNDKARHDLSVMLAVVDEQGSESSVAIPVSVWKQ